MIGVPTLRIGDKSPSIVGPPFVPASQTWLLTSRRASSSEFSQLSELCDSLGLLFAAIAADERDTALITYV